MKLKSVGKALYTGDTENTAFVVRFQTQVLLTLKKRGILTENQMEIGLAALKERSK